MVTEQTTDAARAPRHRADELIATVADRVGARYAASIVYGAPVEHDGVKVIPVAAVRLGFGGGTGSDPAKGGEGEGAGAGASMSPAGYIELKGGKSRFVPIVRPERMVAIAFLAMTAVLTLMRPKLLARPGRRRRGPFIA
jgi:uncharacterized spore protein YtfJ